MIDWKDAEKQLPEKLCKVLILTSENSVYEVFFDAITKHDIADWASYNDVKYWAYINYPKGIV